MAHRPRSEERARRVSGARAARADAYRRSRAAAAVRARLALMPPPPPKRARHGARGTRAMPVECAEGTEGTAEAAEGEEEEEEEKEEEVKGPEQLAVVVKADVQGTAEAVRGALEALASDQVEAKVVACSVGPVSQADVQMAAAVGGRVVAFGVKSAGARVDALAKQLGVQVATHRVIYRLVEEVAEWMAGAAPRVEREIVHGQAEVLATFPLSGDGGMAAGCRVAEGFLRQGERVRVLRAGVVLAEAPLATLRRGKLPVERVGRSTECGVHLGGFDSFAPGDMLQCFGTEMVPASVKGATAAAGHALMAKAAASAP